MLVLERYLEKVPAALAALVVGIAISAAFGLEARGVAVVGDLPAGLVPPQWPAISLQSWLSLLPSALGLALVCFAEAIGPARSFAAAHKYEIDANQEFIGLGAANVGAGLFQGFPIGSSLSKSAANDQAGAHSQMSGIIAALATVVVALFFTQFFYPLPEATLGAIVIVAVSHMVKVDKLKHLYHVRRADFILAMVALLAVLTIETLEALLFAVIVSLFALVWHASQPKLAVLGRAPDTLDFGDIRRHPDNRTFPGLLMVRPENGLFFANAVGFREAISWEMHSSPEPVKLVLIDLGATTDLDAPSADMLFELHKDLRSQNVRCVLARMIAPVRAMLERAGAMEEIGPEDIFADPAEAVVDYLASQRDKSAIRELIRSGLLTVRRLAQVHLSTATADDQDALAALTDRLGREIQEIDADGVQLA
jgi:MFS superfamily sulfate permease-like transporter